MACLIALMAITSAEGGKKKVYITYVLHGNMNYDRYVRPTIWREFPIIYDNLLDFMDEHPEIDAVVCPADSFGTSAASGRKNAF